MLSRPPVWGLVPSVLPMIGAALATVGLILRLTVRDSIPGVALVYYAFQPALIFAGFLLAAVVWGWRRPRAWAAISAAAGLYVAAEWLARDFRLTRHAPPRVVTAAASAAANQQLRVATWNIGGGLLGLSGIRRTIDSLDADVVALVEAPLNIFSGVPAGEHDQAVTPAGLALRVRGKITRQRLHKHRDHTRVLEADAVVQGVELTLLVVDVPSALGVDRAAPLAEVLTHVRRLSERRLIVLGDFNTPCDSVHFAAYRGLLTDSFESAGTGYRPTWPSLLPVLPIDQIWGGPDLRFVSSTARNTRLSDHRIVVAEVVPLDRPGATGRGRVVSKKRTASRRSRRSVCGCT